MAPSPGARERFRLAWEQKGRQTTAGCDWMRDLTLLVVADREVDRNIIEETTAALKAELRLLGARRFRVDTAPLPAGSALAGCRKGEIVASVCIGTAIASLRSTESRFSGSAIYYLTPAALDQLPRDLGNGSSVGPPAGEASFRDGWMVQSLYYHFRNRRQDPTLAAFGGWKFARHSLAHTARHELGHFLGLPHHENLPNPGFPEAGLCTQCTHRGAGSHGVAHAECLMFCGAGDDEWFHQETFGSGFGFCPKCRAAAAAYLKGLESR